MFSVLLWLKSIKSVKEVIDVTENLKRVNEGEVTEPGDEP